MQSVYDAFSNTARRTPDASFLCTEAVTAEVYGIRPGSITWGEAAAQIERHRIGAAGGREPVHENALDEHHQAVGEQKPVDVVELVDARDQGLFERHADDGSKRHRRAEPSQEEEAIGVVLKYAKVQNRWDDHGHSCDQGHQQSPIPTRAEQDHQDSWE